METPYCTNKTLYQINSSSSSYYLRKESFGNEYLWVLKHVCRNAMLTHMKNIGIILDQFPTSTLSHYSLHFIGKSWKVYLQNTPEFNFFHSHPTALIYALWQSRFHSEVKLKSLWSFVSLHRIWPPVTALGPHLTFFPLPHSAPATHTHPCCSSNAQATLPQAYGFCRSISL